MSNFGLGFDDDDSGFDDTSFEGFGDFEESGDFGGFGDEPKGNFDNAVKSNQPVEVDSNTKKTAIIVIIAGITIVLLILFIMGKLGKNKDKVEVVTPPVKQDTEVVKNPVQEPVVNSEWRSFEFTEVELSEKIPTLFTVTDIKHYVKIDSSERLIMKTTVTGSLNGFDGVYKVDIPYNNLNIGDQFKINVRVGKYNGKTVISY